MRKFIATLFMASLAAFSQECSHLYQYDLKTGTIGPKGYLGDTHAAYGIFAFRNNGSKFYIVKGKFPTARFLSFETTSGSKNGTGKSLFDTQVIPDLGSINPFHDGVALNAQPRNYTLVLAPDNAPRLGPNQITFPKRETLISLYVRYYSPTQAVQVQLSDLPTIEAYDLKSGKPAECGSGWPVENFTNYPQFLGWLSDKPSGVFPFELYQWKKGANSAVGKYAQGHSQMTFDEVALIRFKPPTFVKTFSGEGNFDSNAQVRYWSLCATNFPNNQGLVCLADHETPPDAQGFVTIVNGGGPEVEAEALKRGYYYIPDIRPSNSKMVLYAYRNILASKEFKEKEQYKGDYNPKARICPRDVFLAGECEWWN